MVVLQRPFLPYLGLAIGVIVAFGACLQASFHFDDYSIFADPVLTSQSGWWEVFAFDRTRPLTYLTFWANYQLGGRDSVAYHALSLLIHLATVLLLYNALSRMVPPRVAWLAAALFGLHPIQAEPVVYIFARATLLMTLFCVSSLVLWYRGRRWWAVAAFAAALLAKEEAAAFPLFLLLLHFSGSRERKELAPIGAMTALAAAAGARVMLVLARIPDSGAGAGSAISALDYAATQGLVILRYFRLLVIPFGYTVDPHIEIVSGWQAVGAWFAVLAMAVAALRWFRGEGAGFWFLSGLVLLLPSSSVFPADDLAADRRIYLPLMAFSVCAALLLNRTRAWFPSMKASHKCQGDRSLAIFMLRVWRTSAVAVLAVALIALTVLSIGRAQVWKTERTLWEEAVIRSPDKLRPKIQLSRTLTGADAASLLENALDGAPDSALLASELGRRYLELGRSGEALREFGRALALAPNDALAQNNRGVALMNLGQLEAARADFGRAIDLDRCLFDARYNLLVAGVSTEAPEDCRFSDEQRRLLTQNPPGR